MKFAISFFSALVIAIGAILFMQFQVYSEQAIPTNKAFTYSQEIEITYREGNLDIRQHFKNLPNDEIKITWPTTAIDRQCFLEAENSCSRLSEDKLVFTAGEKPSQSISYVIPIEGGLTASKLLKNVFADLMNGKVGFSTVHISMDKNLHGQWVTGVPLIGQQSLSLVNFSMFSGKGDIQDLYWQAGKLAMQKKTESISVYAEAKLSAEVDSAIDALAQLNHEHIAVIQGTSALEGHRMMFVSDLTVAALQQQVIMKRVTEMYDFSETPLWMQHVVAMAVSGEEFGTPRALEVAQQFSQLFDEEMKAEWQQKVKALEGKKITAKLLDEQLSTVTGNYTEYFSMNVDAKYTYPYFIHDARDVYVNGEVVDTIDVLLYNGQILYTADALLRLLDYMPTIGSNGYYVNSEARTFRFPSNEHGFYVFNERRYNTTSSPMQIIAGTYFVEETWMQRLFLVELTKDDESIKITTTAQQ